MIAMTGTLRAMLAGLALGAASAVQADPSFWRAEWPETDFDRTSLESYAEITSIIPRDSIPAIDDPAFVPVGEKAGIGGREPVIAVEIGGDARAYPIRYLTWHEIVNDTVGGVPVAVTFCPLCNSAPTFDRRTSAGVLTFGVTGKLRMSDMVMYDDETQSWWQQAVGEGIVGEMTGEDLTQLPTWMESWSEFQARNPDGLVMAEPEFPRNYGQNPYRGYDSSTRPFLFSGEMPPHGIPALERVVRVGDRAWPISRFQQAEVISEAGVEITWRAGQASALDSGLIATGRDVGTIRVRDAAGADLPHDVMFAFAFHAFFPEGEWMLR